MFNKRELWLLEQSVKHSVQDMYGKLAVAEERCLDEEPEDSHGKEAYDSLLATSRRYRELLVKFKSGE